MISFETLFRRGPEPLLGIDISASSVKLVELGCLPDGKLVLERCGLEPLGHGWINEGRVEKFDEVTGALQRLLGQCGCKTRHVALALPGSFVITRRIMLAADLSADEIEAQVEAEASQFIPSPREDVSLDFCVIGPSASAPGMIDVMLAATRKEKVADRLALAEAVGLVPVVMDVEPYATRLAASRIIEALRCRDDGALIAVCEIGSQTTRLQIMRNGDVIYERDQFFGGERLTRQIAQEYGISLEEAETRKLSGHLLPDCVSRVLVPFMESLGQEISRALQFFFTSTPYNQVDHLLLAGGCAALAGLVESVAARTAIPCRIVNPFDGMVLGGEIKADRLAVEATSYLVATGLALRRFHP